MDCRLADGYASGRQPRRTAEEQVAGKTRRGELGMNRVKESTTGRREVRSVRRPTGMWTVQELQHPRLLALKDDLHDRPGSSACERRNASDCAGLPRRGPGSTRSMPGLRARG